MYVATSSTSSSSRAGRRPLRGWRVWGRGTTLSLTRLLLASRASSTRWPKVCKPPLCQKLSEGHPALSQCLLDLWLDLGCLILSDPARKITLQTFTQPTPVDARSNTMIFPYILIFFFRVVAKLKDRTPSDYPKQWSGFAETIGKERRQLPQNVTIVLLNQARWWRKNLAWATQFGRRLWLDFQGLVLFQWRPWLCTL